MTVGGRRVPGSEIKRILGEKKIVGYARVLSYTWRDDLEKQIELIRHIATL